jgi:hypothetical protein
MRSTRRCAEADTALEDPNTVQFPFQYDLIKSARASRICFILLIKVSVDAQHRQEAASPPKRATRLPEQGNNP